MFYTLYTLGYSKAKAEHLHAYAQKHDLTVVDVRLSPRSRVAEWNGGRLKALLGARYVHVPALGNINYKSDGPITLADPEAGIKTVAALLERGPVVLLCACADVTTCHRRVAAELISQATDAPIQHLTPADIQPPDTPQLVLW